MLRAALQWFFASSIVARARSVSINKNEAPQNVSMRLQSNIIRLRSRLLASSRHNYSELQYVKPLPASVDEFSTSKKDIAQLRSPSENPFDIRARKISCSEFNSISNSLAFYAKTVSRAQKGIIFGINQKAVFPSQVRNGGSCVYWNSLWWILRWRCV